MNIAFTGKAGAGKTSAATLLRELRPEFERCSFATPAREVAAKIWGDEARNDRDKLQKLATALREIDEDVFVRLWVRNAKQVAVFFSVVNDDLRFENEWWAAKELGFVIVRVVADRDQRIRRLQALGKLDNEEQLNHESETAIDHFSPDYIIENNGDKFELADQLVAILNRLAIGQ